MYKILKGHDDDKAFGKLFPEVQSLFYFVQHQSVWILNYKATMGFSITKMIPALIYFDVFRSKTFLTTKIKEENI